MFAPTIHPQTDEMIIGNIKFKTFDLGGHETARLIWKDYVTTGIDAVVYIVDSIDRRRFPEARKELEGLLQNEELADVPFLIFGNKIDFPSAVSEDELRYELGLIETYGKDVYENGKPEIRPVELFMCSVIRKFGYADGFRWLSQFLN